MTSGFDFPDNSHRSKDRIPEKEPVPEKVVESVTNGKVIRRKTPLSKRMITLFIAGDADSVMKHVLMDTVLPKARELITDAITDYVQKMVYGDAYSGTRRPSSSGRSTGIPGYVSYNRYSAQRSSAENPRAGGLSVRDKATHNFDEIILDSRPIADDVLDSLTDLIDQYGQASVSDFYHLVGQTASFVDAKWGWTDIRGADIQRIREGYLVKMPPPKSLER
jgi:hypothetical protein